MALTFLCKNCVDIIDDSVARHDAMYGTDRCPTCDGLLEKVDDIMRYYENYRELLGLLKYAATKAMIRGLKDE